MRDYSEPEARASRPSQVDAAEGVALCLQRLFADETHRMRDDVVHQLTFEELIGALLLAEDEIREAKAAVVEGEGPQELTIRVVHTRDEAGGTP